MRDQWQQITDLNILKGDSIIGTQDKSYPVFVIQAWM